MEVYDIKPKLQQNVKKLKPGKAAGLDGISTKEIKMTADIFTESFSIVCRKRFIQNEFPVQYKVAKLKAAFKKGQKKVSSNYRPLSMLSVPSKLMEGVASAALDDHMKIVQNSCLWGFKQGHSAELLLLNLTESFFLYNPLK